MPRPAFYGTALVFLTVRVPKAVVDKAEAEAKRRGVDRSEVLRDWLIEASGVRVAKQEPKS